METPAAVQNLVANLGASVWGFATIQAAQEAGLLAALAAPRRTAELASLTTVAPALLPVLLDVLIALGLVEQHDDTYIATPGLQPLLGSPGGDQFAATLRSTALQSRAMVADAQTGTLAPGWRHTDLATLCAQGHATAPIFQFLARAVFPQLAGLEERLHAPDGRFLDVGSGVGAVALLFCRLYPQLRVVGLEPQEIPLTEARDAVRAANLEARIELRQAVVETLTERDCYDLIWLPQVFLPHEVLLQSLRTTYAALRPGAWLLLVSGSVPGNTLNAAVARLINALSGGEPRLADQIATMVEEAGFKEARIYPGPPNFPFQFIVGQRPS